MNNNLARTTSLRKREREGADKEKDYENAAGLI